MEKALTQKIDALGYSSYEIRLMQYAVKTVLYEASKFIVMALFFAWHGEFPQFLCAFFCLMAVRSRSGGIHLKSYWSCFLMTFAAFYFSVVLMPFLCHPTAPVMTAVLVICMAVTYRSGPVLSVSRPKPDGIRLQAFKQQTAAMIGIYIVLIFLIGQNVYLECGFWIIVFQSVQLSIAKLKEVIRDEKNEHETARQLM